jgi:hypothetical protein
VRRGRPAQQCRHHPLRTARQSRPEDAHIRARARSPRAPQPEPNRGSPPAAPMQLRSARRGRDRSGRRSAATRSGRRKASPCRQKGRCRGCRQSANWGFPYRRNARGQRHSSPPVALRKPLFSPRRNVGQLRSCAIFLCCPATGGLKKSATQGV